MLLPMLKETNERDLCVTFVLIQRGENSPRKEGAKGRRGEEKEGGAEGRREKHDIREDGIGIKSPRSYRQS